MNTKILANFKMQLNRSILRKEICSVVIISEIIYSKIAKVFDTLVYLVYWKPKHSTLLSPCGLAVDHDSKHSKSKLTMLQRLCSQGYVVILIGALNSIFQVWI